MATNQKVGPVRKAACQLRVRRTSGSVVASQMHAIDSNVDLRIK